MIRVSVLYCVNPAACTADKSIVDNVEPLESVITPSLPCISKDTAVSSTAVLHTYPGLSFSYECEYKL
jgi:hypothetical protein